MPDFTRSVREPLTTTRPGPSLGRFRDCPESRRILEERIFEDRFAHVFAEKTKLVGPRELGTVRSDQAFPCIGTISLSSCLGLAAYDPVAKVGAVAHIFLGPGLPNPTALDESLSRMLDLVTLIGGSRFILSSFNGRFGQRNWNDLLLTHLDSLVQPLLESSIVIRHDQFDQRNFVLDSRTGEIFTGAF